MQQHELDLNSDHKVRAATGDWVRGRLARVRLSTGFACPAGSCLGGTRASDSLTPAAVLVPLVTHREGTTLLLTQRTDHLADHAGEISFPGGRVEPRDRTIAETALRETEEEVGLPPHHVELVGALDSYETGTGFRVTPMVGLIEPPLVTKPDPFEVAEVFEVPLAFIFRPVKPSAAQGVRFLQAPGVLCSILSGPLHLGSHRGHADESL
jgi:NTP pyrophosphohydrolases including oxidative damage repair enzymes